MAQLGILFCTALLAASPKNGPQPPAEISHHDPVQVRIDWSNLSEAHVKRCELHGLHSLTLQKIIDAGFAVTHEIGPEGLHAWMRSRDNHIEVGYTREGQQQSTSIELPKWCESSIQLALTDELLKLLAQARNKLLEESAQPIEEPPQADDRFTTEETSVHALGEVEQTIFQFFMGTVFPGRTNVLGELGVMLTRGLASRWLLSGELGGAGARYQDIWIFEPSAAVRLAYLAHLTDSLWLSAGVRAAVIMQRFKAGSSSGGFVDGQVGLPVRLGLQETPLWVEILPTFRGTPVRHFANTKLAYQAARWGLTARLGYRFRLF